MMLDRDFIRMLEELDIGFGMSTPGRPSLELLVYLHQHGIEWVDQGDDGYTVLFPDAKILKAYCRDMGIPIDKGEVAHGEPT